MNIIETGNHLLVSNGVHKDINKTITVKATSLKGIVSMEKEGCLSVSACSLCPLYGKTCDGVQEDTLVVTIVTVEPQEYEFERDCYSF